MLVSNYLTSEVKVLIDGLEIMKLKGWNDNE